jgi:hypothetical protein
VITRFYSFEEASIYAGVMQSEGHYAVVLDDVIGFFYGPLFVNGFRVLVSDEPVEEEEPLPVEPPQENDLLDTIRIVVSAFAAFGLLWVTLGLAFGLLTLLRGFSQDARNFSEILPLLIGFLPFVALPALWAILGPLMGSMNRTLRDESSVIGWAFRGMAVVWVATQLLGFIFIILMIAWWFIHGGTVGGMFRV